MPLTREFRETIRKRVENDAEFRKSLLEESMACLLSGEIEVSKSLVRDYFNTTVVFPEPG